MAVAFSVQADTAPIPINFCREIISGGNYKLIADISSTAICLNVHDTANVQIDCDHHSIYTSFNENSNVNNNIGNLIEGYGIRFKNVDGFSLANCTINAYSAEHYFGTPLMIESSNNGNIHDNIIGSGYIINSHSDHITFSHNQVSGWLEQNFVHDIVIDSNTMRFVGPMKTTAGMIVSNFGYNNRMSNNILDGSNDGVIKYPIDQNYGADDGIIITEEKNDVISNNTISNIWDCGFESENLIENIQITNNSIINAGFCGIGGWYGNGLKDSVISGNTVDRAPALFYFFRASGVSQDFGKTSPDDINVYFQNNQFTNNKLTNPKRLSTNTNASAYFFMGPAPNHSTQDSNLQLSNNKFSGNDFGTFLLAPSLSPASMIVDGGGNVCSKTNDTTYPLACGRPGSVATTTPTPMPIPSSRTKLMRSYLSPKVYYITEKGFKRWVPTAEIFLSYGNRWEDIVEVSQYKIDAIPNNILIKSPTGSKIYKIENGKKRWISTSAAFARNWFSWDQVAPVNQKEFNYYPIGAIIK